MASSFLPVIGTRFELDQRSHLGRKLHSTQARQVRQAIHADSVSLMIREMPRSRSDRSMSSIPPTSSVAYADPNGPTIQATALVIRPPPETQSGDSQCVLAAFAD